MTDESRRFLVLQGLGAAFMNFVLNGAMAALTFPRGAAVPMWARGPSVGADTIGTSFFLPLFTCLIATAILRRTAREGRAPRLPWTRDSNPLLRKLPRGTFARGALLGLACAVSFAPVTIAGLQLAGLGSMTWLQLVMFKSVYTAILGGLVTPLIGVAALVDMPVAAAATVRPSARPLA